VFVSRLVSFNNTYRRSKSFVTARRVCVARTMPWQNVCPSVTRRYGLNGYTYLQTFFTTVHRVAGDNNTAYHTIIQHTAGDSIPNGIIIIIIIIRQLIRRRNMSIKSLQGRPWHYFDGYPPNGGVECKEVR